MNGFLFWVLNLEPLCMSRVFRSISLGSIGGGGDEIDMSLQILIRHVDVRAQVISLIETDNAATNFLHAAEMIKAMAKEVISIAVGPIKI